MFTFVLHSSMEFDKSIMSCVHHYSIKQSSFTALKSPVLGSRFSIDTLDQAEEVPFIIFLRIFIINGYGILLNTFPTFTKVTIWGTFGLHSVNIVINND